MNAYEQKQENRRARLEAAAGRAEARAVFAYKRADMSEAATGIPFGQPILVGHHSEARHRRTIEKADRAMRASIAESKRADELARRAAAVGTGGISSDDPDAIEKLRDELAHIEDAQHKMKAANKIIRKGNIAELAELGLTDDQIAKITTPDYMGRKGFPSYALSNNNANARRIAQRIKELEALQNRADLEIAGKGYTYREDTTENRVMFVFEVKPDSETRAILKRHAFKWSPSRNAWVRQLTNAGIYAGSQVRAALENADA